MSLECAHVDLALKSDPKRCACGCGHRPYSAGNKMRPLECVSCGLIVRTGRLWIQRMQEPPPCPIPGCTGELMPPCLVDQLVMSEHLAQKHPLYGKLIAGITDYAVRQARAGNAGKRFQCRACQRFIPYPTAHCSCSYDNGAEKYRQGTGRCDGIPF